MGISGGGLARGLEGGKWERDWRLKGSWLVGMREEQVVCGRYEWYAKGSGVRRMGNEIGYPGLFIAFKSWLTDLGLYRSVASH